MKRERDPFWRALADPSRRRILEVLREQGPQATGDLAKRFEISRYGVMKHLKVLVEAGLVRVERVGRQRLNHLVPERLQEAEGGWMAAVATGGVEGEPPDDGAGAGRGERSSSRRRRGRDRGSKRSEGPALSFFDLAAHGFVRTAVAVPRLVLADPLANAREIGTLYQQAVADGAALVLFPELAVSGYSLDDLHQQDALLRAVLAGLEQLAAETEEGRALLIVGAPLRFGGRLYNCGVVLAGGRPIGVVPKTYLPNYREFYEKRQFASARDALDEEVTLLGREVPFGNDLIFRDGERPDFAVHAEICEDVWVPIPPSTYAAFHGATVLANLSASNITIGKAGYRHQLAAGQSAKMLAAYLYAASGQGESTTDLAWDGHALAYEDGVLLAESERFRDSSQLVTADVDLDRLAQERSRMTSWIECAADHAHHSVRRVEFRTAERSEPTPLRRHVPRLPFVPGDPSRRAERCYEAYHIQVTSLVQRLRATGIQRLVIGISGGLDSTQALLVAVQAMDRLGLPRENVLAYTMPGFATSKETLASAHALMKALGVHAEEIDIRPSCERMFADIGHPYARGARGKQVYDVTFENVQAGERTSHLFRLANLHGALVVGTGDLSELALGWATYGVGDHMSHYNVNVSVPKTLIQYLIAWVAEQPDTSSKTAAVLRRILATEISPELVPAEDGDGPQSTEGTIGPYELHDFDLYYTTRRGYSPSKVAYLFAHAWSKDLPCSPADGKYAMDEILRWQGEFLRRFFRTSQFKRSAIPNGPKVGSGGSLSPRGDWRAPSDSSAAPWLDELEATRVWIAASLEGGAPPRTRKRSTRGRRKR